VGRKSNTLWHHEPLARRIAYLWLLIITLWLGGRTSSLLKLWLIFIINLLSAPLVGHQSRRQGRSPEWREEPGEIVGVAGRQGGSKRLGFTCPGGGEAQND
jgi:hypothetical protein